MSDDFSIDFNIATTASIAESSVKKPKKKSKATIEKSPVVKHETPSKPKQLIVAEKKLMEKESHAGTKRLRNESNEAKSEKLAKESKKTVRFSSDPIETEDINFLSTTTVDKSIYDQDTWTNEDENDTNGNKAQGKDVYISRKKYEKSLPAKTPIVTPVKTSYEIKNFTYGARELGLLEESSAAGDATAAFEKLGLDNRIAVKLSAPRNHDSSTFSSSGNTATAGLQRGSLRDGFGLKAPTRVQSLTVPLALSGKSIIVKSETGSGKTLAFLLPIIHALLRSHDSHSLDRSHGTRAVIITPTRELAQQIYGVLSRLCQPFPFIVPGIIAGGEKRKSEKARLRKGCTVLVATPGRLLDHLRTTASFICDQTSLGWIVLDEADRLLDLGFGAQISEIVQCLRTRSRERDDSSGAGSATDSSDEEDLGPGSSGPRKEPSPLPHQGTLTYLVSATVSPAVKSLALEILSDDAMFVDASLATLRRIENEASKEKKYGQDAANDKKNEAQNDSSDKADTKTGGANASDKGKQDDQLDGNSNDTCTIHSKDDSEKEKTTQYSAPSTLTQSCMIVHLKWRLVTILGLTAQVALASQRLMDNSSKQNATVGNANASNAATSAGRGTKAILFLASCDSVEFHYTILRALLPRIVGKSEKHGSNSSPAPAFPVLRLHGNVPQSERTVVYRTFSESSSGLLIATDVAARGLDLPEVDLIIQADAPTETQDYVHRIGRTARKGTRGSAILLLQPHEQPYVELLQAAGLNIFVTDPSLPLASLARLPVHFDLVARPESNGNESQESANEGDGDDDESSKTKGRRRAQSGTAGAKSRGGASGAASDAEDDNVPMRKQYDPVTRVSVALNRMFEKARETRKKFGMSTAATGSQGKDVVSSLSRVAEAFGQAWQYWLEEFVLHQQSAPLTVAPNSKSASEVQQITVLQLARNAFASFVRSYATHERSVRHIFNSRALHLGHAAKAFGLREQPTKVSREVKMFREKQKRQEERQEGDGKVATTGVGGMSAKTKLDLAKALAEKRAKKTEHPLSFKRAKAVEEKKPKKKNAPATKKIAVSEFDA